MATPIPAGQVAGGGTGGGGGLLPYYEIEFLIGDRDYTLNVQTVRILGSIWSIYHTVIIRFRMDYLDVIEQDLYGQKECKIIIRETTEDKEEQEDHEIDLVVVSSYSTGMEARANDNDEPREHVFHDYHMYVCVPKEPYKNMTKIVNYLAQDTDPKSPYEAVEDLINKHLDDVELDILDKNKNNHKMYQLAIPPQTLSSGIDYIDSRYGIYKGPLFYANFYDENIFCMWDLSKKIDENEEYKVHVLARNDKEGEEEVMKEVGSDEETFYTYSDLEVRNNSGNKNVVSASYENIYVTKPDDDLYQVERKNYDDVFNDNSPKTGSELFIDDAVKGAKNVWTKDVVGVPGDDMAFATANLSRYLCAGTEIFFSMNRNLRFKNLLKFGVPIDLITEVGDYSDYQGKYIVQTVYISFTRHTTAAFNAIADFSCIRSNIRYGGTSAGGGL